MDGSEIFIKLSRYKTLCRSLVFFLFIGLLMLYSCPILAKIYKYKDSNGVTHYSDRPFYLETTEYSTDDIGHIIQLEGADEIFLDKIIYRISRIYEIDPALIKAIIKVESDFNPTAVSRAGAQGLMQLMPLTAYNMKVSNPFDPEDNIIGGTRYFKYLLERFDNDLKISLAAYNAGETAVTKYGGVPRYKETREFIRKVIKYYRHYEKQIWSTENITQYLDENNILHITNTSGPFLRKIYP